MEKINFGKERFNHLKEGIPPIRICVETYHKNIALKISDLEHVKIMRENSQHIKYKGSLDYNKNNNILTNQDNTYSISMISEENKFSDKFLNCTGFVAVGVDKETGENISFLTHQESGEILSDEEFIKSFTKQLKDFMNMCEVKTVDAIIFGGNKNDDSLGEYKNAIKVISDMVKPLLGFSPEVGTGPKLTSYETQAYLNTQKRQLYILMPEQKKDIYDSYPSAEVGKYLEDNSIN